MAILLETSYPSGATLGSAFKRADGLLFDSTDGVFRATPAAPFTNWTEQAAPLAGAYLFSIPSPLVLQWTDGPYLVYTRASDQANVVIAVVQVTIRGQVIVTDPVPVMLSAPMTESYAVIGAAPSAEQALFELLARFGVNGINFSGLTTTHFGVNGTTPALVFQGDAAQPSTFRRIS